MILIWNIWENNAVLSSLLLLLLTKQAKGCQITTSDGTFDLSKIAEKSYPFQSLGDYFAFSFCDNVADVSRCMTPVSGSCGIQDHGSDCYSLGTWDKSYEATSTNNSLKVMFANGSPDGCEEKNVPFPRSITFNFECDENGEANIESVEETLTCHYEVNVGTKYVCSDHIIHSGSSGGGGLSDGSIFLICLLVFVTVYCIGGFGFNKYKTSAGGLEAFPQAGFWCTQLPFWVKTGCMVSWAFTVRLFSRIRAKITGNPVNRGGQSEDADGDYENLD